MNNEIKMPDALMGNEESITKALNELCYYSPCKISCSECALHSLENFNNFIKWQSQEKGD